MKLSRRQLLGVGAAAFSGLAQARLFAPEAFLANAWAGESVPPEDHLRRWRSGVRITPVLPVSDRHTMHTYYLLNPETPDGRRVVFYASKAADGHVGQVCVLDRATGKESVLADDVHTEDAHRVALQQWTLGGKAVAYHEVVDKRWRVVVVDVETRDKKVIAEDR